MKKLMCLLIALTLMMGCALGEQSITPEMLLGQNKLDVCLSPGGFAHVYTEYLNAEGDAYDYADITFKRDESGYGLLLVYPEQSGAVRTRVLVRENCFMRFLGDEPEQVLYVGSDYAPGGSKLAVSGDKYLTYPARTDGIQLDTDASGRYVLTVELKAGELASNIVSANGHELKAEDSVYEEYVYDGQALRLVGETLYYMSGEDKRVCRRSVYDYDAPSEEYQRLEELCSARQIAVTLAGKDGNDIKLSYAIADEGTLSFRLEGDAQLYADAACSMEVEPQGDSDYYTLDSYYVDSN